MEPEAWTFAGASAPDAVVSVSLRGTVSTARDDAVYRSLLELRDGSGVLLAEVPLTVVVPGG